MSTDVEANAYYEGDADSGLPGRPHKRAQSGRLTKHVPIRFDARTIARVQRLADDAGLTVSSWIRAAVEKEIRRQTPATFTTADNVVQFVEVSRRGGEPSTRSESQDLAGPLRVEAAM